MKGNSNCPKYGKIREIDNKQKRRQLNEKGLVKN